MSGTKFALKRLKSSDLTLFAKHFNPKEKTRQKSINLDKAALKALYPGLVEKIENGLVIPVELAIAGPGGRANMFVRQNVKLEIKNIRLGQSLIHDPPNEPGRFDYLQPGDFALFSMVGDSQPESIRVCIVAQNDTDDAGLHKTIAAEFGKSFGSHKGFVPADANALNRVLNASGIALDHPFSMLVDSDELEDFAQGGEEGTVTLRARRRGRVMSTDELQRAKQQAEKNGRDGEELLNAFLLIESTEGRIASFEWAAQTNPTSPFDFELRDTAGSCTRQVDAKSTTGPFQNRVHVSMAEVRHMAESGIPYDIYRLYSITKHTARFRVAENVGGFASTLLQAIDGLPQGIQINGFSLDPSVLPFGDERYIDTSPTDESET